MKNDNKINDYPIQNKAIAVVDILGFSNYLTEKSIPLQVIVEKLLNFFYMRSTDFPKKIIKHDYTEYAQKDAELKTIYFSDSILLYLDFIDDKNISAIQEIYSLSLAVSYLLNSCLNYALPIRGAISYGECIVSEDNIFIGKPIIDANKYEKLQNWAGVILTPNAERELENESAIGWLVKYDVPIKRSFCKNWFKTAKKEFIAINWPISEVRYPKLEKEGFAEEISKVTEWPVLCGKSSEEISNIVSNHELSDKKNNMKFRNTFEFWKKYHIEELKM